MSDELALAAIVILIAAMPASLAFLLLADVGQLEGPGRKRRWLRKTHWLAAIPLSVPLFYSLWSAAGAAHLEPLCQAYATPELRRETPTPRELLQLNTTQLVHHSNFWFTVTMDRYQVVDQRYGTIIAVADELWIDAGRSRHYCGVISGSLPTKTAGDTTSQLERFLNAVARGKPRA
ncbi:MAG: hypothetical protein ACO3PC_01000 [Steroidobacteraceae bacterium]